MPQTLSGAFGKKPVLCRDGLQASLDGTTEGNGERRALTGLGSCSTWTRAEASRCRLAAPAGIWEKTGNGPPYRADPALAPDLREFRNALTGGPAPDSSLRRSRATASAPPRSRTRISEMGAATRCITSAAGLPIDSAKTPAKIQCAELCGLFLELLSARAALDKA